MLHFFSSEGSPFDTVGADDQKLHSQTEWDVSLGFFFPAI